MRRTAWVGVAAVCLLLSSGARAEGAGRKAAHAAKPAKLDEPPAPDHGADAPKAESAKPASDSKGLPPLGAGSVFALLPSATTKSASGSDDVARAIAEHLKSRGFRVLPASQVRSQLATHALDGCKNPTTCDPALALATLGADAVISTAVWQRKNAPPQLVVYVRRPHGYGQSEVSVEGANAKGMRAAAVNALGAALEDSERTHEIDVLIESLPMGATVHVDQTLNGTTPAHFALLPGSHLVSVEAPGYVTSAQYLELAEDQREQARLQVKLSAAEAESAAAKPARRERPKRERGLPEADPYADEASRAQAEPTAREILEPAPEPASEPRVRSGLNYVVAAVLLGVAAPFIANAIYAGATRGKCVGQQDADGLCGERVNLGPAFFVSAGVGSAALLTGAAFLVVQPLTEAGPVPQGAQIQLTQRF